MENLLRPPVSGAARLIESLTRVSVASPTAKLTIKEQRELVARMRRFQALPQQLQEGVLRYGEQLQNSYRS